MVLEISMYFEKTPIGILVPDLIFFYHTLALYFGYALGLRMSTPISFSFHITLCYFLHSIYRGECAEQNALGLRRRSLMVLEISMYFEGTPIGILVPFPYLIFFSHHTLLFFALYL